METQAYAKFGIQREREGVGTRNACPHGHFPCADGKWVAIACTSDRIWVRMAENVLDRSELAASHPTTASRVADRKVIDGVVESFTRSLPLVDVVDRCEQGDVPCGAVNTIEDIFNDPQFAAREMLKKVLHNTLGEIVIPNVLPRLSETPGEILSLGPELGRDNTDVLDNLVNDENEIRRK